MVASSWPEEFVQRYETHGLALLHNNEADWIQRTNEYGLRRPTRACQIFVYRAFDLWSQMGPMYRATVSITQFMIPDEILWRIAVYWPDLGNHWHEASWRLHPVDDSRSASCLPDLIHSTYVLVMPGLLNEMAHRPHGLLEVTQGDMCHVRATALPPKINLPILQEFLKAFCRRGWPMVRCVGTHNRVPLTDELQDCHHGFFVQITIARAIPTHAVDVTRWCSESGQLMHLDYQYYAGDSHQFLVGVAHGLTLLASSLAPCWGDRERRSGSSWSCDIGILLCAALLCISIQYMPPSMTWMRAMTQGAPTWLRHQWARLASQWRQIQSYMCEYVWRVSSMKEPCGVPLPLPVLL